MLERIVTHTGRVFRVESLLVRDGQGSALRRDVVRHPGAVTVIGELADGRLVMIRNWRVAVSRRLLEFCAGKLEPGEDPAHAARRELEEECGYAAGSLESLGTFYTSPGFADELMHVYLARDLTSVPRRLEPGETIDVELVQPEALPDLIRGGDLVDGKTIVAWALLQARRGAAGGGGRQRDGEASRGP